MLPRFVANYFEGAQRFSTERGYVPGSLQDSRFDVDQASREELVRKSRSFDDNNSLYSDILETYETYMVGKGLTVKCISSNPDWNKKATEALRRHFRFPERNNTSNIVQVQRTMARTLMRDGEWFGLLTRNGSTGKVRARIQTIETHRVRSSFGVNRLENGNELIDGIELNNGRVVAYHIVDGDIFTGETAIRVPAEQMIHVFERKRADQLRGIPICTPAINDIIDLNDIIRLEKQACKAHASVDKIVKTKTGELPTQMARKLKYTSFDPQTTNSGGSQVERAKWCEQVFGTGTKVISHDDSLELVASQRPSVATQQFYQLLVQRICVGCDIPLCLVFPQGGQGTQIRLDLDKANAIFQARSQDIQWAMERIALYFLQDEIETDPELNPRPADWYRLRIGTPMACNVDKGNSAQSDIALLDAGLLTYSEYYERRGQDGFEKITERIEEEKYFLAECERLQVDPATMRKALREMLGKQPMEQPEEPEEEDEPAD